MKKNWSISAKLGVLVVIFLGLFACEPISVSVNTKGDIAFARMEGIFFYDAKVGKITTVSWTYGTTKVPIIVRWAPDNETIAYTVKPNKDEQNAEIYMVKKTGGNVKKLYSTDKVITQMEWSPDGKYVSVAQQGSDSDLGVADLVLISAGDGMSKVVVSNTGDVHNWLDEKTIALVKISGKNGDSSDVLNGKLTVYKVDTGDTQPLLDVKVTKTGALDTNPANHLIAFTALQTGPGSQDFLPAQIDKASFDSEFLPKFFDDDQKALFTTNYVVQKGSYRLKSGLDSETKGKLQQQLSSIGYLNTDKPYCFVVKVGNNLAEQLSPISTNFLQFSPDGSSLLVKAKHESKMELGVLNIADKSYKTLATDIADTVSANSGNVQVYPSWAGNTAAVYFTDNQVYGSNGLALTLMSIETTSLKKHNLQVGIDSEVARLVESKGGY